MRSATSYSDHMGRNIQRGGKMNIIVDGWGVGGGGWCADGEGGLFKGKDGGDQGIK